MSLRVRSSTVLLLLAALLPGCSLGSIGSFGSGGASVAATDSSEPATGSTRSTGVSLTRAKPLDAYVVMGGNIKRCWFNPVDPLLPNHVYRADVSPGGTKVKITVHQRANLGRAGVTTYIIDFTQSGPSTVISTENRKMTPEQAAKMEFDIKRWQRGEADCSNKMPATAAATQ